VRLVGSRSSPKHTPLIRNVTRYFGEPSTIGRLATEAQFAPDLSLLAEALRGMYGLDNISEDGFRKAVRHGPNTFKVGTTGIAPGTAVLCKLPCCGAVVRLVVPKRTKSLIFPPPPLCAEGCVRADNEQGTVIPLS